MVNRRTRPAAPVTHRATPKPRPTVIPPEPVAEQSPEPPGADPTIVAAAHAVLASAPVILAHLDHEPGCPSASGGSCTCGLLQFKLALDDLRKSAQAALDALKSARKP